MHIYLGWAIRKDLKINNVHDHMALPPSKSHATVFDMMFNL